MNVLTRGIKNSIRSPLRSGAIVLMFAISIALILSMLVARSSVESKINEVKSTAGTNITIRPAGVMGAMGGGDPLTADQIAKIKSTAHVASTTMTLTDQVSTSNTSLQSSLELGAFGRHRQSESSSTSESESGTSGTGSVSADLPAALPNITATGTTNSGSVSTTGSTLALSSGEDINATSSDLTALVGSELATKNNLSVGSTFTLYGKTITVKGIYTTNNKFEDSGLIVPLATLQSLTNQSDAVNSIVATVDSSDNVAATVASLKSSLGESADITSEVERAESSVSSLQSIASLALTGVVAAAVAGAAIILLAMIMVVRERRREIGVMKAIGGTDSKVVGQFIVEGFTLTVLGALVGIGLGILASGPMTTSLVSSQTQTQNTRGGARLTTSSASSSTTSNGQQGFMRGGFEQLRTNATQVTASLTPQVLASAIGITLFISLIGTAIPAWFTARVRPAEVLRSE